MTRWFVDLRCFHRAVRVDALQAAMIEMAQRDTHQTLALKVHRERERVEGGRGIGFPSLEEVGREEG